MSNTVSEVPKSSNESSDDLLHFTYAEWKHMYEELFKVLVRSEDNIIHITHANWEAVGDELPAIMYQLSNR